LATISLILEEASVIFVVDILKLSISLPMLILIVVTFVPEDFSGASFCSSLSPLIFPNLAG